MTDATLDNGCIYLIPKNCAPVETDTAFRKAATVDKTIVNQLLQNSRALQVRRHGVRLGFRRDSLGIGMLRRRRAAPEISQDFFAADSAPIATEYPVLDGGGKLPAHHRQGDPCLPKFRGTPDSLR